MLFSLSTTHRPATDLGYLLHKNPNRVHRKKLSFGEAFLFYTETDNDKCEAVLLVEVDPVGLVRKKGRHSAFSLEQYVNDRPYAASSFLSVAIAEILGSALNGRSRERPELVDQPLPFQINIPVLPSLAGVEGIVRLFEPLGYDVQAEGITLDDRHPSWGSSRYYNVHLSGTLKLKDVLSHLYVLFPVLDKDKHYYVGPDELEKLLAKGEAWLPAHPERELIVNRYLKYQRTLTREAFARLRALDEDHGEIEESVQAESVIEEKLNLHEQRLGTVVSALKGKGVSSVIDLGCGEGRLLQILLKEKQFTRICGMDVSSRALSMASNRLKWDRLPELQKKRLQLFQGSLLYKDSRLQGFDAAVLVEVIEHLETDRLNTLERVVFGEIQPDCVIITTPNSEYNVLFESMSPGQLRHRDHRFEWTRDEFGSWADDICRNYDYRAEISPVGPVDEKFGSPSQMVIFGKDREEGLSV